MREVTLYVRARGEKRVRVVRGILCGLLMNVTAVVMVSSAHAQVQHCTATLRLEDAVTLGALQFHVDYPGNAGFDGTGSSVDCTNLTLALPNFQDDDAGRVTLAFVAFGSGITGPLDLVTCEMTNQSPISESDLSVTVTDASDMQSDPMSLPEVSLSLFCDGDTTTTVSTSTTTTTLSSTEACTVRVKLDDPVTIGSMQVEVDYSHAAGEFSDTGSAVDCRTLAPMSLGTYFDDDVKTVGAALITLKGFTGPVNMFECDFLPVGSLPVANDFSLKVTDAGDTNSDPIVPRPSVSIASIVCVDPNATTTTTTTTTTSTTTTTVPPADLCGDADLNLHITASDAQRILHAAVGLPVSCPMDVCDTSGDSHLSVGDAQRVLRSAVGLPSQLLCV
jgi:hypothetical protein